MSIDRFTSRFKHSLRSVLWPGICALILCTVTLLIYFPGLYGDFEFDDSVNIVDNKALAVSTLTPATLYRASVAGGIAGPLKRPISVATLVINRYITGLDPFYMKLTNVLIHLFNGISLFFLTWLLLQTYYRKQQQDTPRQTVFWMAFSISALWTVHPLALTSVLYIIQRMTSISAFFTIWGLISYVIARGKMLEHSTGRMFLVVSFVIFLMLGAFSKENGLLLPLLTLVIEVTLFRFQASSRSLSIFLMGFYSVVLLLPLLIASSWLLFHTNWLTNGYKVRTFNLSERLMTEARVLWFYLRLIILPDTGLMGIFHDDIPISQNLLTPWTTIPAIVGLFMIGIGAWVLRNRLPILSFGVLFFLAGHCMESSIIPLEIAHEHRNYLPMYGIIFTAGFYIFEIKKQLIGFKPRMFFMGVLISLIAITTYIRASYWGNVVDHTLMEVRNHPNSGRTQYQTGSIYWKLATANPNHKDELFKRAREHLEKASRTANFQSDAYLALIQLSYIADFKMEQSWFDQLLRKLQYAPFQASTPNMIHSFTLCEIDQSCKLPKQDMQKIFNTALKNPTLVGRSRAGILSTAALYAANQGDFDTSLNYLYQATRVARSDLNYRLTLIDLLIKLNDFNKAKTQLAIIKKEDKLDVYSQRISDMEKMLEKHQQLLQKDSKPSTNSAK